MHLITINSVFLIHLIRIVFLISIHFNFISTATIDENDSDNMKISTVDWHKMIGENRPPTNDDYLFVTGPGVRMNIVYTNPPKANCETCAIEISLRFWANWNRTKFPVIKEGTELFRLAVMPCNRAMPATKFIRFDDFDPSTWNYFVYTASAKSEFNFKCDKKVDIEVSDNEDYQSKITLDDQYLIAIKDLHMKYYCFMKTAEPLLSNETCSGDFDGQSTARCVDVTCNKNNCPASFSVQGGYWSPDNLPSRSADYQDFWYTNENWKTLTITLTESQDDQMTCINIGYWITGKSYLSIEIGQTIINLHSTKIRPNIEGQVNYKWENITFCPSQFTQKENITPNGQSIIKLTSHLTGSKDLIAVSLASNFESESHLRTINNYLHHFSRPEASSEWYVLPKGLKTDPGSDPGQPFAIELALPSASSGTGYIFSRWFKYSAGLKFRGTLKSDELFGHFSAKLSLHESNGRPVYEYNLFMLTADSMVNKLNQRLGIKLDASSSIITNKIAKSTLCFIMITINYNTTKQSKLVLSDVDVGDGCRESELVCMGHGKCINLEPDQYQCSCDSGWTGSHCASVNFCETIDPDSGLTGNQFCELSEGKCNPITYSPVSLVCDCDKMRFWTLISSSNFDTTDSRNNKRLTVYRNSSSAFKIGHCEPVSKCVGISDLCPTGYACDEESWSSDKPCQICNRALGYIMFDGQCVKIDACYKKCGNAKCSSIGVQWYCYCDEGQELDEDGTTCKPKSKCLVWDSQKLKCSHDCEMINDEPKCTCYSGYTLMDDGKSCKSNFNCTIDCPEGSICKQDGPNEPSTCVCPLGWDRDEVTSKCTDICRLADQGNEGWKDYIRDACGNDRCNLINNEIQCICTPPTVTNKMGLCELEKICFPHNRGHFDCTGRNALCEPRSDGVTFTYRCLCPPGKAFEDGVCVDQCASKIHECAAMNAVCRISEDIESDTQIAACKCRPGFVMTNGYCYLAHNSIKATFTVKLIDTKISHAGATIDDLWESFCSNIGIKFLHDCRLYTRGVLYQWFNVIMETQLDRIIDRYVDAILGPNIKKFADQYVDSVTLIEYEANSNLPSKGLKPIEAFNATTIKNLYKRNSFYNITVSLQMKSKRIGQSSLLRMLCDDVFDLDDPRHDYCLIPSQTLIQKGTIIESDLIPCSEKNIDYCPMDTTCIPDIDETKFRCSCNPGYEPQAVIKLDMTNSQLTKQYCIDIDECSLGQTLCPGHSRCINTRGSYRCECEDGWINDGIQCIELCEYQDCQHGECQLINNHTAICRCDSWYTGDKCETINKIASFWRTMTIVVAVSLSSILIIYIVTTVTIARRSKSTVFENGYLKNRIELTDSMYMRNIRPSSRSMAGRREPISSNFDLQLR